MSKRLLHYKSAEQDHEERHRFIRQNASSMELKALAREFFAKFNLRSKSAAYDALLSSLNSVGCEQQANEVKVSGATVILTEDAKAAKLSLLTATKRRRTQLEISGVIKGSHMIQSGMDTLVPETKSLTQTVDETEYSPYSTVNDSQGGKCSNATSPCVAYQKRREARAECVGGSIDGERRETELDSASVVIPFSIPTEKAPNEFPDPTRNLEHFATLGQAIVWNVEGIDVVQKFHDFRIGNLGPFALARDGIADLTNDSSFCQTLDPTLLSAIRRAEPAPNIYERWPTLGPILDRVFVSNNYDEVAHAICSESMHDPIAAYLFVIIMAYWQYFQFHEEVPENINEREGFAGLTWSFMQTPLTMYKIQSRYLDVLITAVEGRKNQDKNPLLEVKEVGHFADAVATYNNQQLLLAEAALIHAPKLEKRRQDEFKLARAMRDSWISHVRSISSLAVPPRDLAMFGSVSFKDETKLLRMDFQGVFRLQQFDLFIIPLGKRDFGNKMKAAVISCLELAARLHQETERRRQSTIILGYYDRVLLADALRLIAKTTSTPTKILKTQKKK
ncbi:hypothetical protein BGZ51_009034 [Haplosporangium sp. Z 767]|nr:hypothetical protein BGZ51_009034 [Haplosporangium sp. Z 767]